MQPASVPAAYRHRGQTMVQGHSWLWHGRHQYFEKMVWLKTGWMLKSLKKYNRTSRSPPPLNAAFSHQPVPILDDPSISLKVYSEYAKRKSCVLTPCSTENWNKVQPWKQQWSKLSSLTGFWESRQRLIDVDEGKMTYFSQKTYKCWYVGYPI